MHLLRNPLSSTFLSFLLLPLTNAYQIDPRQISSKNTATLACDTRNLPDTKTNIGPVFNITSTCIAQFLTTCSSSPSHLASVEVPVLDPNQLDASESNLCGQGVSNTLPKITPAVCYCACRCMVIDQEDWQVQAEEVCVEDGENPASCVSMVQSMSVTSAASVSTSAWSNYTATVTGSASASSSSSVRGLGPQEGFERKARV